MRDFNIFFAIFIPVYVYVFLVSLFIVFLSSVVTGKSGLNWGAVHYSNKHWSIGVYFVIILAALLGTPPTIGFFGKILIFYVVAHSGIIELALLTTITLILLIFYVQSIRTRGVFKKQTRHAFTTNVNSGITWFLVYGLLFCVSFTLTLPFIIDVVYSAFV